jgi:hypothetical protein
MIDKRVAVSAACAFLLVTACGSIQAGGSRSRSPIPTVPAFQHVDTGLVSLAVPSSWHVRRVAPNPSGNWTSAFLSPGGLSSECQTTADGGSCHPWPLTTTVPGGIVVAVREYGMPGSRAPSGGDPTTVGGVPARRVSGSADSACAVIGGAESIRYVVPTVPGWYGWLAIDACLAGGDMSATEAILATLVASVTIPVAGPAPTG